MISPFSWCSSTSALDSSKPAAHQPELLPVPADLGELVQAVGVDEDDLGVAGVVGSDVVAGLEQPVVCEEIGKPHDVRPEAVLCVEHQAGRDGGPPRPGW